jgi:hypothetical protein
MTVATVAYATREAVKAALDVKTTARSDPQVDDAIAAATDSVEGFLHRVFYPQTATRYIDWPNYQGTSPWKIYLDASELADVTATVPVVTTRGSSPQTIPAGNIIWGPSNYAPPYTVLELDRSSSSAFGVGSTPQRDVHITGTFGYWIKTTPGGALAAAMSDTTGTAATVTSSAAVGVGDQILVDSERMLVTDKAMVTTSQTQQSGLSTNSVADVALGVTDGSKYFQNELLLLDSERLLVVDVAGNVLTVKRGWDGSIPAVHSGATIYAQRQLTVTRGDFGTAAATHSNAAPVSRNLVPGLVRQLTLAEAVVAVTLGPAAYATTQGSGAGKQSNVGAGVPDVRERCYTQFGRKGRSRVV